MHLVPCIPPTGELDRAPRTSLCEESASESWDGFWADERYYTRCTRSDGTVEWYRIVDTRSARPWRSNATCVLPFRQREDAR